MKSFLLTVLLLANVFILYAKSLPYPFVYDDLWRVATNESIKTLKNTGRFFTDTTTQSSIPDLHKDSYRPLVTLSFAVDYTLFKLNPAGYRAENIFLHGLNGVLIFFLGIGLLSLSWPAAFFSALIFLNHPIQTESVVWIVERTNVLGMFFLLSSIGSWYLFQTRRQLRWASTFHITLILSLLTREIAVVIPVFLFLIDYLKGLRKQWFHYGLALLWVGSYLTLRSFMLGQVKISEYKGGSFTANLANVAQVWPLYWKSFLWPDRLRTTYADIDIVSQLSHPKVLLGLISFVVFAALFIFAWRRSPRWALALGAVFLFWLPGSNLIPLTTIFAERLMYVPMIGFCWMAGLFYDRLKSARLRWILAAPVIIFLSGLTWIQLSVWQSERALWKNATEQAPRAWFAWACYGQMLQTDAEKIKLLAPEESRVLWEKSIDVLAEGLKYGPTQGGAARMWFFSSRAHMTLGNLQQAKELAEKATQTDPSLAPAINELMKLRR